MTIEECNKKRKDAEKDVCKILCDLENDTGMSVDAVITDSVRGIATPERIQYVSIRLVLA